MLLGKQKSAEDVVFGLARGLVDEVAPPNAPNPTDNEKS